MKKIIIGLILLVLSLGTFWGCGGSAGSPSSPSGENHGVPSIVQLQPSHFVAQTNTSITLHAKVLDGNGAPVANTLVTFTNLSPIGVLSSTTAKTNSVGIATVTLKSTTEGFSTVQAEVSKDVGQARDRKTFFFSSINVGQPVPTLDLTVSGHGDPFVLFEPGVSNDDEVTVTATVFDGFGRRVAGIDVLFGSDSSEATFPLGSLVSTDTSGQASVLVKVIPSTLRSLPTTINITALAANGAFNMVSLTVEPVKITNIILSATPTIVEPDGTSTITAAVTITTGGPAPDGTTVNFTSTTSSGATCGSITPFAQTTNGVAQADFTAPSTTGTCIIKASAGGITSNAVSITVTTPPPTLTVTPPSASVTCTDGGARTFVIIGGTPQYSITPGLTDANLTVAPTTVSASGGSFTATVKPDDGTATGTCASFPAATNAVPLVITDTAGKVVTATLTITNPNPSAMTVTPASAAICENTTPCTGATSTTATFTIAGGTPPYTVVSGNTSVIASPGSLGVGANTFTVDAIDNSITANTPVTLTITDSATTTPATVTRTVNVVNQN